MGPSLEPTPPVAPMMNMLLMFSPEICLGIRDDASLGANNLFNTHHNPDMALKSPF